MDRYPAMEEWPYPQKSWEVSTKRAAPHGDVAQVSEFDTVIEAISQDVWIFLKSRYSDKKPLNRYQIIDGFVKHILDQARKKDGSNQWLRTQKALRRALGESPEVYKDASRHWTYYSYAPLDSSAVMDEALARKRQINFREWKSPCVDPNDLFNRMGRKPLLQITRQFWDQVCIVTGTPHGLTVGVTLAYMQAHYTDLADRQMIDEPPPGDQEKMAEKRSPASPVNQDSLLSEATACVDGPKKWSILQRQVFWLTGLENLKPCHIEKILNIKPQYHLEQTIKAVGTHLEQWNGPKFPFVPESFYKTFLLQMASYCQKTAPLTTVQTHRLSEILKESEK
nr:hypothetical protein [Desulfobacula sp.]